MGRKIAYEYHGEIPIDDRDRLKSRFLAGEKMVLVCKDMLVESFSHNPLLLVYYCKLGKNPSTVRMAQAFKRSRRVIRKDGINIKEMSHAYYGVSGANLLKDKFGSLADLDKFKEFYKIDGEVDPEYQKLLEQGILSLQKLKYDVNTEDGAKHDRAILEEAQARMRDFDDLAEDLQNQGLGKTIETSTPMYTIVDVNEGHQKKTFEADWYTFYPEGKWTREKAMRKVKELIGE